MTADNPAVSTVEEQVAEVLRRAIAAHICNVSNLPKPMQTPALGLHMGDLIDGLTDKAQA